MAKTYRMRALPTTVVIDRAGQVVAGTAGARDWDSPAAHAVIEALLERPDLLKQLDEKHGARDATARGTALEELAAMEVRTSQYNPENQVPEKSWVYRIAKRFWFNDFGVYRGHDHGRSSAPALLRERLATSPGDSCGTSIARP